MIGFDFVENEVIHKINVQELVTEDVANAFIEALDCIVEDKEKNEIHICDTPEQARAMEKKISRNGFAFV